MLKYYEKIKPLFSELLTALKPPPKLLPSEWAEKYRVKEGGGAVGSYKNLPYQIEPLDCFNDPTVEEVVMMWSAQSGKTQVALNVKGYIIDQFPRPIITAYPDAQNLRTFSKTKLSQFISETPCVKDKVTTCSTRTASNTVEFKEFAGNAWWRGVSTGSPNSLRAMSAPNLFFDEIDGYKTTSEGNPITLLLARSEKMPGKMAYYVSTPTDHETSLINKMYEESDKRKFWVPCYHCGEHQVLVWKNIHWDKRIIDEETGEKEHLPETAHYVCEHCGCVINDGEKIKMVARGEWRASQKSKVKGRRGYHIWEVYSSIETTFEKIVRKFLIAKDNTDDLRAFVNTVLGETFGLPNDKLSESDLLEKREVYFDGDDPVVPQRAAVITAGVDVHPDRIECTVRAWGENEESWGLEYFRWDETPLNDTGWNKLTQLLNKPYKHESGANLYIASCAIDKQYGTDAVLDYIDRVGGAARAVQSSGIKGYPPIGAISKHKSLDIYIYNVGSDTIKNTLFHRSTTSERNRMHWNYNFNATYFKQFTSERRVQRKRDGKTLEVWENPPGSRNEAWDCEVYALAALKILAIPNMKALVDALKPEIILARKKKREEAQSNANRGIYNSGLR